MPRLPQQFDITGALRAEPEVRAAEHDLRVQGADQHGLDELLGRLGGQRAVEAQHEGRVDTRLLEQVRASARC